MLRLAVGLRCLPCRFQLGLSLQRPFFNKAGGSAGKLTINNLACGDGDAGSMIPVLRMEVRWHMVEPIDCDTNSVKTADLGHGKMLFYLAPIVKSGVEAPDPHVSTVKSE